MLSKVKSVEEIGIYENERGVDVGDGKKGYFKHEYVMEDDQTITSNHKTHMPFPEGTEIEYEVKGSNEYGSWGSVVKPNGNNHSSSAPKASKKFDTTGIEVGHAINNGVLLAIADGNCSIETVEKYAQDIMRLSRKMNKQIQDFKSKPAAPAQPAAAPKPEPMPTPKAVDEAIDNTQEDDLPF